MDRWNDDRLDDLARNVRNMGPAVESVAVVRVQMDNLSGQLRETRHEVSALSKKLEVVIDEPLKRSRDFRRQLMLGVLAALAGGAFTFVAILLGSTVH